MVSTTDRNQTSYYPLIENIESQNILYNHRKREQETCIDVCQLRSVPIMLRVVGRMRDAIFVRGQACVETETYT